MPDIEELQPIYESECSAPLQRKQEIAHSSTQRIKQWLYTLQRKARVVLCVILVSILASCFLLETPRPKSMFNASKSSSEPKQKNNPRERPPSVLISKDSKDNEIGLLSQSLRQSFNQVINNNKLSLSQLNELKEMILSKQQSLEKKRAYHNKRAQFFQQKSRFEYFDSLKLEKYNMDTDQEQIMKKKAAQLQQYEDMNYNYHFNSQSQPSEIPFCVVVYAAKTKKQYAPEYFLTSLLNQNYSNFKTVIVFDDKKDAGLAAWKEAIHYSKLSQVELVANPDKLGYWESIKSAINSPCCADTEVVALMNGNDELLGFHVFNVFNEVYHTKQANLAYSNFLEFHKQYNQIFKGFSGRYEPQIIENNQFRQAPILFGSLLTFRKELFSLVRDESVVFETEYVTEFETQIALYLSLLQLSCGKIEYIPLYFYLFEGYKFKSSNNGLLEKYLTKLRGIERYKCFKYMQSGK